MVNGKADAFVYDLPYCVVFNAQQGKGKLVFLDKPFTFEPLAWAINKGDPDFMNWLNNFLRQVKNDGRYDRIYKKWIKGTNWIEGCPGVGRQWSAGVRYDSLSKTAFQGGRQSFSDRRPPFLWSAGSMGESVSCS